MKRVEGQEDGPGGGDGGTQLTPNLGLSEEVFAEGAAAPADIELTPEAETFETPAEESEPAETAPEPEAEARPDATPEGQATEPDSTEEPA
jgi:hypothetical protein